MVTKISNAMVKIQPTNIVILLPTTTFLKNVATSLIFEKKITRKNFTK
jgi:hypothetical protein